MVSAFISRWQWTCRPVVDHVSTNGERYFAQARFISFHYFKRHRQAYYDYLQAARDRGDWEGWLTFFLQGIIEVSAEATETARRILALREAHRGLFTENLGRASGNGHKVLEELYDRPIVSVAQV